MAFMKTDVIHLETFDDIDSIRDRMEWSTSKRLVLVWPKRGDIRINQLELILLARKAIHLGTQVAIVNGDGEIDEAAAAAGIPVFHSQTSATLARWPLLRTEEMESEELIEMKKNGVSALGDHVEHLRDDTPMKPAFRAAAFISGILAVFSMVFFFIPGANIRLFPGEIDQTLRLTIHANPAVEEADIAGNIPLLSATTVQSASDTVETTGQLLTPDQYARGVVVLKNLTGETVSVPAGTIVTTLSDPPVRFETLTAIESLAGGEEESVAIRAVLPGSAGNVAEEEIQSLEGSLGLNLSAVNEEPTSGGSESSLRSASEDDVATLRQKVKSMLLAQARENFLPSPAEDQKFLPESLKIQKIIEEEISTPAGKPADFLEISLTGEISLDYLSEEDMKQAMAAAMNAGLPARYEALGETLSLKMIGDPIYDPETNSVRWEVEATRKLRATFSSPAIVRAVTGKSNAEAIRLLSGMLSHKAVPQIEMTPSWWPRLPFLPFRIEVTTG